MVNQVKYAYNSQSRLEKEFQAHGGSVNTSTTPYVGYSYDTTTSGDVFTRALRPTSMTYPDGRSLYYGYGTSGSVDDILNRVATLTDDDQSTTLATYSYQGVNGIVKTELNEPGLTLDYTTSGALDRFGRVTDHAWNDGTNDVVRIKHGYDRASNRLYREDTVARASTKEWDELYSYDGVNQLVSLERGSLTTTKDSILSQSKNFAEDWSLDMTGNWSTFKQDTNGDGTWDLNQARTHNAANEITAIAGIASNVSHDLNGNMTTIPQPSDWSSNYSLTYDAWNRLVEVEDGASTVAEYAYDARNHRVVKTISGTDRHFYYNAQWQCLEERVDSSTNADLQYIWGRRYIDDLVLRERSSERLYSLADPNWNVAAITDENASVQSRLRYDAYGTASTFNASYASASLPTGWSYTFTTRRLDSETGCMYYRNRYYHPSLGRFQKRDPIGYEGGDLNVYRYASSSPSVFVDLSGTSLQCPTEREREDIESCENGCADLYGWYNPQRYICQGLCDNLATGTPDAWESTYDAICPIARFMASNPLATCVCAIMQVLDSVPGVSLHPATVAVDGVCAAITTADAWCTAVETGGYWDSLRAGLLTGLTALDFIEEVFPPGVEQAIGAGNAMVQNALASNSLNIFAPQFQCLCEIASGIGALGDVIDEFLMEWARAERALRSGHIPF